ncbi:hypothetical protein [Silvibacterium acidisoli]|uniref:hypothetical protein n=1 Tax=Acidobacteriaceae bacterium ZG23-2 TaxID=2883246 RepID=UPI00406CE2BC
MVLAEWKRKIVALAGFGLLAGLAWWTMDPGRGRDLVLVLLGGFALRVMLTAGRSRYDKEESPE